MASRSGNATVRNLGRRFDEMVPVLAGFAGCGLVAAADRYRQPDRGLWRWLAPALALAAYSVTSWSDVLASQAAHQHFNYGKRFMQQERFAAS